MKTIDPILPFEGVLSIIRIKGIGATKQALILSRTSCPSIRERIRKTELFFIIYQRDVVITSGNNRLLGQKSLLIISK